MVSVDRHGDHLTRVAERWTSNCYLVREADGYTLVDTGAAAVAPAILAEVAQRCRPLWRIVLTHAHGAQVGGLDALVAALPGPLEIIVGRREAPLLRGDFHPREGEPFHAPRQGAYGRTSVAPTTLVEHGDYVGSLRVVATPGHTPGHVSLLDVRDGTLLAGGAVPTARSAVAALGARLWGRVGPVGDTWDPALAEASLRRLGTLGATRIASGHGPVLEDASAALDRAAGRLVPA